MIVRNLTAATLSIACLLLALPAAGEQYAFLAGVQTYTRKEFRPLQFSDNDINELAKVLLASGYPPEKTTLISQSAGATDPSLLPLFDNINRKLDLMLQSVGPQDTLLLAFAGHGVQFEGDEESYFCPMDAVLEEKRNMLSLNGLYERLKTQCKAKSVVILVDACRNDPTRDYARGRTSVNLASVTRPPEQAPPGGVVALFSCSPGQQAWEHPDLKHGVFFHHVITGLNGQADYNRDQQITLTELELFAKTNVQDYVRNKFDRLQTPFHKGESGGELLLARLPDRTTRNTPTTAKTTQRPPAQTPLSKPRAVEIVADESFVSLRKSVKQIQLPPATPGAVPLAIISFSSNQEWVQDLEYLSELWKQPEMLSQLHGLLALREHLDNTKPSGLFVSTDGDAEMPALGGFTAVLNFQALVTALEGIDLGGGVYLVEMPEFSSFYFREHKGWAYFSTTNSGLLAAPPDDPLPLLGGLEASYDVGMRVYAQNIPAAWRDKSVTMLEEQLKGVVQQENETDDEYASRLQFNRFMNNMALMFLQDMANVTVGVNLDRVSKSALVELSIIPVPGTQTAEIVGMFKSRRSHLGGFSAPDAALSFHLCTRLDSAVMEHLGFNNVGRSLKQLALSEFTANAQDDDAASQDQAAFDQVVQTIQKQLQDGELDGGAVFRTKRGRATFGVGFRNREPSQVESAFRAVMERLQARAEATSSGAKFSEHEYEEHTILLTEHDSQSDADIRAFGKRYGFALTCGEEQCYFTFGAEPLATVQQLIDDSLDRADRGAVFPPAQMFVSLDQILAFVARQSDVEDAPMQSINALVETLAPAQCRLRIVLQPNDAGGLTLWLTAPEGALQLLGEAVKNAQAAVVVDDPTQYDMSAPDYDPAQR